jgi:O-antigen/teichoic acid export membrane protein
MVAGTWLLGGWGLRLFAGDEFVVGRAVLIALAAMAAFYLLSETVSQSLFALGRGRLAALGWFAGLFASAACLATLGVGVVERVSYSLALGTLVAAVVQAGFFLALRRRPAAPGR